MEEAQGGFRQFATAGAQDEDVFPFGQAEVAVLIVPAITEQGVTFAGFRQEIRRILHQPQGGARGVVVGQLAGDFGQGGIAIFVRLSIRPLDFSVGLQVVLGDRPGPQDAENGFSFFRGNDFQNGGFDPFRAGPAIEDERDAAAQLLHYRSGGGGGNPAKAVGAGGGQGTAEAGDHRFEHRMGTHAYRHGGQSTGDRFRQRIGLGQHQGERPGPEFFNQHGHGFGNLRRHNGDVGQPFAVRQMHDQRVKGGAFLGLENTGHRGRIEGIGSEAVDGFAGQGDHFAFAQKIHRLRDGSAQQVGPVGGGNKSIHLLVTPSSCFIRQELD